MLVALHVGNLELLKLDEAPRVYFHPPNFRQVGFGVNTSGACRMCRVSGELQVENRGLGFEKLRFSIARESGHSK